MRRVLAVATLLLAGQNALAMEPPTYILSDRADAALHVTVAVASIAPVETGDGGDLDTCRVAGHIVAVHRGAAMAGTEVELRLPCWDAGRAQPAAPAELDVWGRLDGTTLTAASFETVAPPLEIVDRVAARLSQVHRRAWRAVQEAMVHAGAGLELREAGRRDLVILGVRSGPCVRSEDIVARYGPEQDLQPVPPGRPLPAPWYLGYATDWGQLSFGIEMTRPHDLDGCLVEVILNFADRT